MLESRGEGVIEKYGSNHLVSNSLFTLPRQPSYLELIKPSAPIDADKPPSRSLTV